jgi:DNA-binding IclR family transcriptional regulator
MLATRGADVTIMRTTCLGCGKDRDLEGMVGIIDEANSAQRIIRENPVRSLAKAVLLLEALASEREATPRRLAEVLNEPRTTIYRLLTGLEALDMVETGSQTGTWRLGWRLLRLGSAVIERLDERQAALPVMEQIHQATEETVFLCVRRGDEAVCIERIDGLRVQSLVLRLGGSLPLHAGAAPRTLLAWEPRSEWEAYMDRAEQLDRYTDRTPVTRTDLFAELQQTVDQGYAVSDEDITAGIGSLGAPIFDYTGKIRAAISIGGMRQMLLEDRREEAIRLLVEGAQEVSTALGFGREAEIERPLLDSVER